jgi:hypothetical protein
MSAAAYLCVRSLIRRKVIVSFATYFREKIHNFTVLWPVKVVINFSHLPCIL